jgi:hypothetical protein
MIAIAVNCFKLNEAEGHRRSGAQRDVCVAVRSLVHDSAAVDDEHPGTWLDPLRKFGKEVIDFRRGNRVRILFRGLGHADMRAGQEKERRYAD